MYKLEHNFARVFEELARLDMFRVYHRVRQNTAFECRFHDAPTESVSGVHMHESSTNSFRLLRRAIYVISDCLLPIDNHERLIRLCSSNDSINSSHRYSHALYLSIVLSRVACSTKSRFMLSLALSNCLMTLFDVKFCYFYIILCYFY